MLIDARAIRAPGPWGLTPRTQRANTHAQGSAPASVGVRLQSTYATAFTTKSKSPTVTCWPDVLLIRVTS